MTTLLNSIFYIGMLILTSCIHLERNPNSGYGNSDQVQNQIQNSTSLNEINSHSEIEKSHPINYKLMADIGINPEALNKPEIKKKYELQLLIKTFEKTLFNDREKKQYYSSLPWFKDDGEQLDFLKQPGYEARLLWMRNKNFGIRATQLDDDSANLIEKKDVALGMSQENVKKSWGLPDTVEVSGNPLYRNERWRYKKYVPSTEGYKLQKRLIYFEGGKLVGWEQFDE